MGRAEASYHPLYLSISIKWEGQGRHTWLGRVGRRGKGRKAFQNISSHSSSVLLPLLDWLWYFMGGQALFGAVYHALGKSIWHAHHQSSASCHCACL